MKATGTLQNLLNTVLEAVDRLLSLLNDELKFPKPPAMALRPIPVRVTCPPRGGDSRW